MARRRHVLSVVMATGVFACGSHADIEAAAVNADALSGAGSCATVASSGSETDFTLGARATSDCSSSITVLRARWQPTRLLRIPIVVHVITDEDCATGDVSDALIHSQIAVLNEDFRALPSTLGAAGVDSQIEFYLATSDPDGHPTTGITRHCNATWYQDRGEYFAALAWDPLRYVNIYTNSAGGAGGYVPELPAGLGTGLGGAEDRVVVNWLAFGRGGPTPRRDQGRTTTHEMGHYLGLYHTFDGSCAAAEKPGCYTTGDRICDTAPDEQSHRGCPAGEVGCGGAPIPITNYMEYTDDACRTGFTPEQVQRMRCSLETYRPLLAR